MYVDEYHLFFTIFKHSEKTAQELTMKIHSDGQAIVGIYSFEIAEQKAVEATKLSRENGYPLQIAIDKEQHKYFVE